MSLKPLKILFFILIIFQFTGCSLGFLIQKDQKVTIVKDSLATIQINKEAPKIKNSKYLLPRNAEPQQITIMRDGYKTQYGVCMPYKLSAAGIGTIALNATIVAVPVTLLAAPEVGIFSLWFAMIGGSIGGIAGYFPIMLNQKFYEYDKVIYFNEKMIEIPIKDSVTKEIFLNKVAVDLSPESSEDYYLSYQNYKKGKFKKKSNIKAENGLKLDDTFFSDELNSILKKNGFIDTTGLVLRSNYNQNAYLDATIIGYKWLYIPNSGSPKDYRKTGFINIELNVKWDVLDFYKKTIYSDTIKSKSGEFVSFVSDANSDFSKNALKDALETGLYTLMNDDKFSETLRLPKIETNTRLDDLLIDKSKTYVTSIEQAVQSTVTIKTQKGHGSGFIVCENGYLLTNYHMISDTAKLEVIMNDGSKYIPKIIRYSKESDLALLKIEKNNLIAFQIPEVDSYNIGKEIYVIGTPSAEDLSQTLTKGIISSIRKQANGSKIIQTDASISRGNSGGPMIDKEGNLLGIVNAKLIGFGIEGISFAIPSSEITKNLSIKFK